MREPVTFIVPGKAVPKGRPRFSRAGHTYTDARTKAYETMVGTLAKIAMRGGQPIEAGVLVSIEIVMKPPSAFNKRDYEAAISGRVQAITGLDVDNAAKACLDAMNAIVYKDDRQITSLKITKCYGVEPHVKITVYEDPSAYFQA